MSEDKFVESLHLAQMGMFNLLENDVEQISQLATFAEGLLDYHSQCTEILRGLTETLLVKKDECASRPKMEFVPKSLTDLNIEVGSDGVNGTNHYNSSVIPNHSNLRPRPLPHTIPKYNVDPFDPWSTTSASPLPSPMKSPARTPITRTPCCIALYDFDPENPGELGFKENDVITLINKIDENWFEGSFNGRTGYFPVTYVKVDVPLP